MHEEMYIYKHTANGRVEPFEYASVSTYYIFTVTIAMPNEIMSMEMQLVDKLLTMLSSNLLSNPHKASAGAPAGIDWFQ